MNGVNSGPVPSKKVFLYEIPQLAVGTKIRFLGWYGVTCSLPNSQLIVLLP